MKYKYLAVLMGAMITVSSVPVMATEATDTATESAADEEDGAGDEENTAVQENETEILGEVETISDNTITIAVGTRKDMGQGGRPGQETDADSDAASDTASDAAGDAAGDTASDSENNTENAESGETDNSTPPEMPDDAQNGQDGQGGGEAPSSLDLTGEELTVTITDDTVITKISGGMGKGEGMNQPQDGQAPDSDAASGDAEAADEDADTADQANEDADTTDATEDTAADEQTPPEIPEGDNDQDGGQGGGQAPEMTTEEITLDDISEGDVIAVTTDEDGNALTITVQSMGMGGGMGGGQGGAPGGQSQGVDSYDSANEYTEDEIVEDASLESTGTDENAALVSDGAEVTFSNDTISRTSTDSTGGDNSSFYGVGAALLATDGTAYVSGSNVTTDAAGGAGLFAYGDGTVYAADSTIKTTQDTSGGIHAAGGGTLYAWDLNVETNGESAAAIRSDRGGGTMVVDGGSYTSNGLGSPAVYCTADIAVNNATLTATGSEAVCIEGLNSLHLYDSTLTGNMADQDQNDSTWNIILYQSMSGDSEVGNSTFQMDGGSITAQNGGMFYTTNTECTIALNNVAITYSDDNPYFLQCTGNTNQRGWGTEGANGSDCHFTATNQEMQGNIIWDSISDLDFYMTDGSTLTGAVVNDETYAGNGGDGYCNLYVGSDSTWTVTGDSTLTSLSNEGTIVDADGKTVSVVGTDGTSYVEGDSAYTITVESYEESADLSDSTQMDAWSDYEVERPADL